MIEMSPTTKNPMNLGLNQVQMVRFGTGFGGLLFGVGFPVYMMLPVDNFSCDVGGGSLSL